MQDRNQERQLERQIERQQERQQERQSERKQERKWIFVELVLFLFLLLGTFLLLPGSEALTLLKWFSIFAGSGLLFLPIAAHFFKAFPDKGFLFSCIMGSILVPGYLLWNGGVLLGMPFSNAMCRVFVLAQIPVAALTYYLTRNKGKARKKVYCAPNWTLVAEDLLAFYAVFLLYAYLIGFKGGVYGTEKFMDYGMLKGLMICDKLPPEDIWFAGQPINYYYGGQYFCAFFSRLTGTDPRYAYNFCRALIPAILFSGVFSLARNFGSRFEKKWFAVGVTFVSAIYTVFAGNAHTIYAVLMKLAGKYQFWFSDATRFIDDCIHEFPSYSYLIGDLHAHMINVIFVVLILALLYSYLCKEQLRWMEPEVIGIGFLVGLFKWTNYWDFIIYLTVALFICTASALFRNQGKKLYNLIHFIVITAMSFVIVLPFLSGFDSQFSGVAMVEKGSAINEFLIIWWVILFFSIVYIVYAVDDIKLRRSKLRKIDVNALYALVMVICELGLIAIPEFVYVVDIYTTYPRTNTMFKLTYQAFIMFAIVSGYLLFYLLEKKKRVWFGTFAVLLACCSTYFLFAAPQWLGEYGESKVNNLDAESFLDNYAEFAGDKQAIRWMEDQLAYGVVLEAPGLSYSTYERVSITTGFPTVIGWQTHEWLWRNSLELVQERQSEVRAIYTGYDSSGCFYSLAEREALLQKYQVRYVFIGSCEREAYAEALDSASLTSLCSVIYADENSMVLAYGN